MTDMDFSTKLAELDRLLNDPDTALEPARVWSLLEEVALYGHAAPAVALRA